MRKRRILDRIRKLEEAASEASETEEVVFQIVFSDGRAETPGPVYVCRLPAKWPRR